jgi:hypothetical protein
MAGVDSGTVVGVHEPIHDRVVQLGACGTVGSSGLVLCGSAQNDSSAALSPAEATRPPSVTRGRPAELRRGLDPRPTARTGATKSKFELRNAAGGVEWVLAALRPH